MKCKRCKHIAPDGSLFCNWCGQPFFKQEKKELAVPKPRQLSDGRWTGQLMVDGKRISVYGKTIEDYELNARATKAGLIAAKDEPPKFTLVDIIDKYIAANENVLSPATLRGYSTIRNNRFASYMDQDISGISWQAMVNDEAKKCSPKTVKNAWGLVSASMNHAGYSMPSVNLPMVTPKDELYLDYEQIQLFMAEIKDKPGELAALLGLHSLRESEILALKANDIRDGYIHVDKAMVPNANQVYVLKHTTKTQLSTRDVPIMIPRLLEILPEPSENMLCPEKGQTIRKRINRACKRIGLPEVGCHGLRRSFASLCWHLKIDERTVMQLGGWSNMATVHKHYIKLSKKDTNPEIEKLKNYFEFTTQS